MSAAVVSWIALAAWLVVLAVRMTLAEAVWPAVRLERRPRRALLALDVLLVVLGLTLAVGLGAVLAPAVLNR